MSKTQLYIRRGKQDFAVTNNAATDIRDSLPVGVYRLSSIPFVGWVFESIDNFDLPPKFYGKLPSQASRILSTYEDRLKNGLSTGVLLRGSKGAGKTLLAKKVALDSNRPVVVINQPFDDDSFKELIAGLGECVVIFDEFEKTYRDQNSQNALLTLFDGVFAATALMFVIVNDSGALVRPLLNRPGRLYYSFDYRGLEKEFIQDYCNDRLHNKENIIGVLSVATMFEEFNFDMLQALVEEMNRYNETASESVEVLNIDAGYFNNYTRYAVHAVEVETGRELDMKGAEHQGHPLRGGGNYYFYYNENHNRIDSIDDEDDDDNAVCYEFHLTEHNLIKVDPENDIYIFQGDGVVVSLSKVNYNGVFSLGSNQRSDYENFGKNKKGNQSLDKSVMSLKKIAATSKVSG